MDPYYFPSSLVQDLNPHQYRKTLLQLNTWLWTIDSTECKIWIDAKQRIVLLQYNYPLVNNSQKKENNSVLSVGMKSRFSSPEECSPSTLLLTFERTVTDNQRTGVWHFFLMNCSSIQFWHEAYTNEVYLVTKTSRAGYKFESRGQ